jgi:hypothetical protein
MCPCTPVACGVASSRPWGWRCDGERDAPAPHSAVSSRWWAARWCSHSNDDAPAGGTRAVRGWRCGGGGDAWRWAGGGEGGGGDAAGWSLAARSGKKMKR